MIQEAYPSPQEHKVKQVRRLDRLLTQATKLVNNLTRLLKEKGLVELSPTEKTEKLAQDESLKDFWSIYNAFILSGGLNENKTFAKYSVMTQKLLLHFYAFLSSHNKLAS
jgi:hypothetical protein